MGDFFKRKITLSSGKKNPHLSKSLYKHICAKSAIFAQCNIVLYTQHLFAIMANYDQWGLL